ncbi:MAG: SUMF1/EgtB/PvdO family nonheme iron enzyme [Planctomycetota bacterium]
MGATKASSDRGPGRWGARRSLVLLVGLSLLLDFLLAAVASAATHAVIISVPECRSGRYPLPLAQRNDLWLREALVERLRLPEDRIHELRGEKATKAAIRSLLRDELPRLVQPGDRVIVYYTGHGSLLSISGAPLRMYFTYEAAERPGKRPASERWELDTVINDFELEEWLEPLHERGAETILLRECCFSGSGYSESLAHEAPLHEDEAKKLTPATYELSACSANESAYPVKVKSKSGEEINVGAFTAALVRALAQSKTVLTLEDVASFVEREVGRTVRGQTPSRGGKKERGFPGVVLLDRSKMVLVIHVIDAWTREELKGVKVFLSGREPAASPATLEGVARSAVRVFPWIEKEGFVPSSMEVKLDDTEEVQEVTLELEPEYAQVVGRVVEASGQPLESVQVACRAVSGAALAEGRFDTEARPDASGRFTLRVAPRVAWELVVFSSGRVLATQGVNGGKPLEPVRRHDRQAQRTLDRGAYDVGTVNVTLPRTGPTEAELLFDRYFARGQEQLESGKLAEARGSFESARDAIAGLPQSSRKSFEERVSAALARVDVKVREKELNALESEAHTAQDSGDLDRAETLAKRALDLDKGLLWADVMLKDIARTRERQRTEREAAARLATAEREAAEKKTPDRTPAGAPRTFAGFTYRGKNAQGKHEYVHDMTGLEFVYIEPGTFMMGSPGSESGRYHDEEQHQVMISKPFLIAKYEVTQEVWEKVMGSNRASFKKGGKYPVENVSWNDVMEFCKRVGLELPTEAQWEYACRAGTTGLYAGDLDAMGWYGQNSGSSTHPVGQKSANAWGLYDMHGNVWEWCADWYGYYPSGSVTDPTGPSGGSRRVLRGGSWRNGARDCRSANRYGNGPGDRNGDLGFRPARS